MVVFGGSGLFLLLLVVLVLGGPLLVFSPLAPILLIAIIGVPLLFAGLAMVFGRRRGSGDELVGYEEEAVYPAEGFEDVLAAAKEDLLALADEIRELDLEIEMPGVSSAARAEYGRALDAYERASGALDRAGDAADLRAVSKALEEGRFAMASARARLEGREPPERRPPCFFDPRHGPSVRDVEWAPPYGAPRRVPACAADAIRIEEGVEPHPREVAVAGRQVPYWDAPVVYAPYAGGFFGGFGSVLPGLLVGSALGSALVWGVGGAAGEGFHDSGEFGYGPGDGSEFG
jgi:hypothetical protein